jgi:hypothetical protein
MREFARGEPIALRDLVGHAGYRLSIRVGQNRVALIAPKR